MTLVELKNGKVIFKQKPLSFEKLSETLQDIVNFREMLALRIKNGDSALVEIPHEHMSVIAKLTHESDKTLAALSKSVQNELLPTIDDDGNSGPSSSIKSILPLQAVEASIKLIAVRKNYGLDSNGTRKVPASFCIWRWEVDQAHYDWLPKNVRDKVGARLDERIQAKKDLIVLFGALTQEERDGILDPKGKVAPKDKKNASTLGGPIADVTEESKGSSTQSVNRLGQNHDNEDQQTKSERSCPTGDGAQALVQSIDPGKPIKEKENAKNKVGRPRKEKKESESHVKSRSMMANFLGKFAKPMDRQRSHATQDISQPTSSKLSDFEKTFKPFLLKKDAELAPVNWFTAQKTSKNFASGDDPRNAIVVENDESQTTTALALVVNDQTVDADIADMSNREHLLTVLSSLPPTAISRSSLPPYVIRTNRTIRPPTVRDLMSQIAEAELSGDVSLVRSLLSRLKDHRLFVPKVFAFTEDTRPGYFGTWTRTSANIRLRRPFKRDPVAIDYGYDSGGEWEDETSGDGDDVVEDGDEDAETEEADSDLDSWLADDDEVIEVGTPPEERNGDSLPPNFLSTPSPPPKRKSDDECQRLGKKRKVVVPLVPFAKGPCWEQSVGQCEFEFFKPYQIQLFNDTPFPIDPFTFVSAEIQDRRSNAVFVVPALPDRLTAPVLNTVTPPHDLSTPSSVILHVPAPIATSANHSLRRTVLTPKTTFPDVYLPQLLSKITSLQTGNLTFLVESIYQELRGFGVKKNAVEAKLKEVGEKSKEKRVWIVKNNATQ